MISGISKETIDDSITIHSTIFSIIIIIIPEVSIYSRILETEQTFLLEGKSFLINISVTCCRVLNVNRMEIAK